jgi:hypothetical protein
MKLAHFQPVHSNNMMAGSFTTSRKVLVLIMCDHAQHFNPGHIPISSLGVDVKALDASVPDVVLTCKFALSSLPQLPRTPSHYE